MKQVMLMLSTTLLFSWAHAETRSYQKTDANTAKVQIETDDREYTQAAQYLDGQENKQFIEMLLADPNSALSKIVAQVEQEMCVENSTPENPWIDGCGQVELTNTVQTSFGRGGWMEGYAGYTFFVGFRHDGTGMQLDSLYMTELNESAVAQTDQDYNYKGTVEKTLSLSNFTKLPSHE